MFQSDTIKFLHIGKTGGSALKGALRTRARTDGTPAARLVFASHSMTMPRAIRFNRARVVFFLRDPVSRFVSAFNSRLRQGRPRYDYPWRPEEKEAFAVFQTPTSLAEALASPDEALKGQAERAMRGIRHVRSPYAQWLVSPDYLDRHRHRVHFIGFQETFDDDCAALMAGLGLGRYDPPPPAERVHATPEGFERTLSREGEAAIAQWYAADYALLDWARRFRDERAPVSASGM